MQRIGLCSRPGGAGSVWDRWTTERSVDVHRLHDGGGDDASGAALHRLDRRCPCRPMSMCTGCTTATATMPRAPLCTGRTSGQVAVVHGVQECRAVDRCDG